MPAPFDAAAAAYDLDFTGTRLARVLRARTWARLDHLFPPGARVLELGCGTGEDARYLAGRGRRVVATDQSPAMLALAAAKTAGLPVTTALLDLGALAPSPEVDALAPYDGVLANFGALNILSAYGPLADFLAPRTRPEARLVFVVMGRWCAWEIAWHLARGRPQRAFRRARGRSAARLSPGQAPLAVFYPTTGSLRRDMAPHFRLDRTWPLGTWLPPSYLEPLTRRRLFPWAALLALERHTPWPPLGDHTVYEFVRTAGG